MNSLAIRLLTPLALVALLGGCDLIKKGSGPKGQVVATVDGQEVTLAELQAELGGNASAPKAAQQAALQRIIARDLLAKAAHDQKLDQTPEFAVLLQRAKSDLAASLLERKMAGEVPPPTKDDADRFVEDHPTMFAQRQLIVLDQVQAPPSRDINLLRALQPLKDLGQAEQTLDSRGVPHQRTMTTLDTLNLDPRMAEQIEKATSDDLLIFAGPRSLSVNQVKETHSMPFTGETASQYALRLLTNQRSQEAVQKQAQNIVLAAQDKIKYNPEFQPPKSGSPAAAAQPSAAAPAAQSAPTPELPAASDASGQPFTLGK